MKEFLVTCISKTHRDGGHQHITHIGNNAEQWRITTKSVAKRLKTRNEVYYIVEPEGRKRFYLGVVPRRWLRAPYVRAHEDGVWNDQLLALPQCTSECHLF